MHGNTKNKKECSHRDSQLLRTDLAKTEGDGGEVERQADRDDKPEVFLQVYNKDTAADGCKYKDEGACIARSGLCGGVNSQRTPTQENTECCYFL